MASPADGMNLDNDNSRDGDTSVASMTPALSPAQTPFFFVTTRKRLRAAFHEPVGDDGGSRAPIPSVDERSFSSDAAPR